MSNITCFGEVLWDEFPEHKKIGGAPLNVAIRLKSFGNNVSMISKIGADKDGREIFEFIKENEVNTDGIQVDDKLKTGNVKVVLNAKGSASYSIMFPRAWDNIDLTAIAEKIVKSSEAFVYGSLVARDETSKNTLYELLKVAKYKIFDVNLREPHYTKAVLLHLMNQADFIKFNDDEIFEISAMFGSKSKSLDQSILFIAEKTNTKTICVTKGKHGAILYVEGKLYHNSGYLITVVDTVGAGDSFLAGLISNLLNNEDPQKAIDYACAIGALVASKAGANPKIEEEEVHKMITS
ncbi:carbohydrate kinase [Cellulophaga baltica]|uniref:carbohydrate kinase family protein n=1 Tax=Cellulophaga TaxID=104264 RepID=UPI001C072E06|nr:MULTISPECIES: carbohydrate kinase [Cellulophaga]MBU2998194.1 carbohydrate kinase [Cellulophaga baltica]MDO6769601.1 carbohydrate kinase [Cellulophaga sp. 1_MG-2023]